MNPFQKAQRQKAKLRLAITGPSGSGKTWGGLLIAKGLGGKIAVIDTERGSASLYTNLVDFDVMELSPPYTPERFIAAVKAAESAGYDVLLIDSASHEWNGVGGCLELVDHVAQSKFKGNTWSAWNDVTPRHRAFLDSLLRSNMHVIATMRSKTETAQTEENGRKKVVKLGMKSEQRDGIEYEFTTVLDLTHAGHYATASKDRTGLFAGDPQPITEDTGRVLLEWLESGAEPSPLSIQGYAPEHAPQSMGRPRKSSSQAKKDGDDVRVKAEIEALSLDGVRDWFENFDALTETTPRGWLDPIRDMLELRREELMAQAKGADLDEAFRGTMAGAGEASVAGRGNPVAA